MPGSYALVGMAATTAASIHAPMTAAVLVFELSGDYPIVLPLLLATIVATSISRGLGSESVYEAELPKGNRLGADPRRARCDLIVSVAITRSSPCAGTASCPRGTSSFAPVPRRSAARRR